MDKVLITGANGFIGRKCLEILKREQKFEIHAISTKAFKDSDVVWHQTNLLNNVDIHGLLKSVKPSHLLHLAWITSHGKYWNSMENLDWLQYGIELIKTFYREGGKRVVITGTCAEYDWKFGLCSETKTPLKPSTLYGVSKKSMQETISSFAETTGLSVAWGRLFFVYGPYENKARLIPSIINSLLENRIVNCSHGNQIRDYIHVYDAAEILVKLLCNNFKGAINIGSGKPVIIKELISKIAINLNSPGLVKLGVIPVPSDEPPVILADTDLLIKEVDFTPYFNIDDGLSQVINWWKKEKKID